MYTNRVIGTAKCIEVSSFQGVLIGEVLLVYAYRPHMYCNQHLCIGSHNYSTYIVCFRVAHYRTMYVHVRTYVLSVLRHEKQ